MLDDEFENSINYFKNIMNNNILKYASHKIGATFIGIKTNITGHLKLHIYILIFPFIKNESVVPYSYRYPNIYFKDLCLDVDESFYLWIYDEMKRQNSIVIMSLESNILKVVNGNSDLIISIDKNCNEKKEWMFLEYEEWYEKKAFDNKFTLKLINPYLYMVPFPVKQITIQNIRNENNYIILL
jgi:hypothetical protein